MAKNILKLTEGQAIVKINGTGTETITLATELLSPTQIIDGTPTVGIQFLQWSTGGSILVQRNSATIFEMYNGSGEWICLVTGVQLIIRTQRMISR